MTTLSVVLLRRWMASSPMWSTRVSAMTMWSLLMTAMPFWDWRTVRPAMITWEEVSMRIPPLRVKSPVSMTAVRGPQTQMGSSAVPWAPLMGKGPA